jgi:hypothetical protein
MNALQANIQKGGQNSYYYAHSDSSGGLRSTLGESPRLLEVIPQSPTSSSTNSRQVIPINTFAWADADRFVKIYIDFEGASSVLKEEDVIVNLKNEGRGIEVRIVVDSKNQELIFKRDRLHATVSSVKAKRFEQRVIVTLTKEDAEGTWYELESKGGVEDD